LDGRSVNSPSECANQVRGLSDVVLPGSFSRHVGLSHAEPLAGSQHGAHAPCPQGAGGEVAPGLNDKA
jgi:hypothetical protein